jgi:hypothetical protein
MRSVAIMDSGVVGLFFRRSPFRTDLGQYAPVKNHLIFPSLGNSADPQICARTFEECRTRNKSGTSGSNGSTGNSLKSTSHVKMRPEVSKIGENSATMEDVVTQDRTTKLTPLGDRSKGPAANKAIERPVIAGDSEAIQTKPAAQK